MNQTWEDHAPNQQRFLRYLEQQIRNWAWYQHDGKWYCSTSRASEHPCPAS